MSMTKPLMVVVLRAVVVAGCVVLGASWGCGARGGSGRDMLELYVQQFNDNVRWKRFDQAAQFLVPEQRAQFLARFLTEEEDLQVESIEVRHVEYVASAADPGHQASEPQARVTVAAQANLLPSTVVKRVIQRQTWVWRDDAWRVMALEPLSFVTPGAAGQGHEPGLRPQAQAR